MSQYESDDSIQTQQTPRVGAVAVEQQAKTVSITLNGQTVQVPNIAYVTMLEKRIRTLEQRCEQLARNLNLVNNRVAKSTQQPPARSTYD